MKRLTIILLLVFSIFFLVGCGSDSASSTLKDGQSITLSDVTPVCSSKDNVDKLISYMQQKNNSGIKSMYINGEVKDLPKGSRVNVVNTGIVTEIETSDGSHWYGPMELFK